MSRSYRKIPIAGVTTAQSDKKCKVQANKQYRRISKVTLEKFQDDSIMKSKNEVTSKWDFAKDGKRWFDDYPEVFRK